MFNANWYKFAQNRELAELLCNTGQHRLVNCSVFNKHWSAGVNINDLDAIKDTEHWPGKNKHGYILAAVRTTLQQRPCPPPPPSPESAETEEVDDE